MLVFEDNEHSLIHEQPLYINFFLVVSLSSIHSCTVHLHYEKYVIPKFFKTFIYCFSTLVYRYGSSVNYEMAYEISSMT